MYLAFHYAKLGTARLVLLFNTHFVLAVSFTLVMTPLY